MNDVCELHPMHTHGHKSWIHSYGAGMYEATNNIWFEGHNPLL